METELDSDYDIPIIQSTNNQQLLLENANDNFDEAWSISNTLLQPESSSTSSTNTIVPPNVELQNKEIIALLQSIFQQNQSLNEYIRININGIHESLKALTTEVLTIKKSMRLDTESSCANIYYCDTVHEFKILTDNLKSEQKADEFVSIII